MSAEESAPSTFAQVARDPAWWVFRAGDLAQAGMVLWRASMADLRRLMDAREPGLGLDKKEVPNIALAPVAMLLFGLAVENLLKAIIVSTDPNFVKNDKLGRWGVPDHNLAKLADRASFELEPTEREFLDRLSSFVQWRGRYPVPNRANQRLVNAADLGPVREDDADKFRRLLDRLHMHGGFPLATD